MESLAGPDMPVVLPGRVPADEVRLVGPGTGQADGWTVDLAIEHIASTGVLEPG